MTVIGAHPTRLDLVVHAGDTVEVSIPVLDGAGAAVSLSGWTCTAKAVDVGGTVLHDFSPTIVSDNIVVAATATQTAAWTWPVYAAQLIVTATPSGGGPAQITHGWIRFYRT